VRYLVEFVLWARKHRLLVVGLHKLPFSCAELQVFRVRQTSQNFQPLCVGNRAVYWETLHLFHFIIHKPLHNQVVS